MMQKRRQTPPPPQADRNWAVLDSQSQLVCLTVYKRGAMEVVRRLAA